MQTVVSSRLLTLFSLVLALGLGLVACDGGGSGPPEPEISGLQPSSGPPGTRVTINGAGFSGNPSAITVTFDGNPALVSSATETEIVADAPRDLPTGAAPVEVNIDGESVSGPDFSVKQEAPGISSVQPNSGTVGTDVIINGMNFSPTAAENTITIGGTEAPVIGAATDQLRTEVPTGAANGPVQVTVRDRSTTGPEFDVITEGTLEVITATSGSDQDSDGYTVSLDGGTGQSAGVNDTTYFPDVAKGGRTVKLSQVAENCGLGEENPRSVQVSAGDTTSTVFEVECRPVARNQIVFMSRRDEDEDREIFLMNPDGSNVQQLTENGVFDNTPVISYDATQIAFSGTPNSVGEIVIMNADGSNQRQLTSSVGTSSFPTWAPDDQTLAFSDDRTGNEEIFRINADGTGEQRLTFNTARDYFPRWSPADTLIAFTSLRDGGSDGDIYTMRPDGSNITQLTSDPNTFTNDNLPSWSPNGSRIAFSSDRDGTSSDIYTMNPDGSAVQRITSTSADNFAPTWSPDGSEIAFVSDRDGNPEIYKINADGSGSAVRLTNDPSMDTFPHWSPKP
jgi:Tol biopolymer transport system component